MRTAPSSPKQKLIDVRQLEGDDLKLAHKVYHAMYRLSFDDLLRHNTAAHRFLPNTISRVRIENFSKAFLLAKLKGE